MKFATFDLEAFEKAELSQRTILAAQLDKICRDSGFLVLTGHGVPDNCITDMQSTMQTFFKQTPDDKQKVKAPYPGYPYGYLGPNSEALAKSKGVDTPPDLKESFNGGPQDVPNDIVDPEALEFCYVPTIWPDLESFKPTWQTYYGEMENLASRIMVAFAVALNLPDDFFEDYINHPISALRALNYPATDDVSLPDQQRAGAHTDYGSLTILLPQAESQGLQVALPDGGWLDVPTPEGAFVINIGDLMARWTADRWVSTLHRVVAKPHQPARQSLAFFHQPNWDAVITPLDGSNKYEDVLSGPYLMEKFKSTGS
ncbi:isopenicillin N synthase family dioxygenase [Pacificibacter marinus]|uniref:2-oxoglutarate-dependent ethylene/succinate-forming enzyme n=1 Tax=Pacificibacter marinus TaxID=658057 RepID=A0A1Y5TQ23_9RHOB|nr:2OG-Fe(II) oxygenase family protein [Pacificibacter marinus]SEL36796.1 Isopenicillin N synthase [Pacificibacter marinus]SLN69399.1 2-oxoglutarate-dependent ethylene/succinate-forming enzyme [Pacificibacter marinus]